MYFDTQELTRLIAVSFKVVKGDDANSPDFSQISKTVRLMNWGIQGYLQLLLKMQRLLQFFSAHEEVHNKSSN